jgi:hypothetical protein
MSDLVKNHIIDNLESEAIEFLPRKLKRKYHPGPNKEPTTPIPKKQKGKEELNKQLKTVKEENIEDLLFID